jgi:predicted secreted protein
LGQNDKTVLNDHLMPFMDILGSTHFLQERALCNGSKCIKDFLADKNFEVIDWPGNGKV